MRGRQIAEDAQRREENVRGEKKGERSVFRSLKGLRRSDARKRTRKVERERERERRTGTGGGECKLWTKEKIEKKK